MARTKEEVLADMKQLASEIGAIADKTPDSGAAHLLLYAIFDAHPELKARATALEREAKALGLK